MVVHTLYVFTMEQWFRNWVVSHTATRHIRGCYTSFTDHLKQYVSTDASWTRLKANYLRYNIRNVCVNRDLPGRNQSPASEFGSAVEDLCASSCSNAPHDIITFVQMTCAGYKDRSYMVPSTLCTRLVNKLT